MRKQLTTEPELKNLVGTQYVFTEVLPTGDDFELFKKVYKITIDRKELPRNFIISAQGELIKDFKMTNAENLSVILKDGIDKTGGLKGEAGYQERVKNALAEVAAAETELGQSPDSLDPLAKLVVLERTSGKQLPPVKNAVKKILRTVDNDPERKPLLIQARMLDSGGQLAEENKTKRAIEMYQTIVEKFPDSPGAKAATERIAELEQGEAKADDEAKADGEAKAEGEGGGESKNAEPSQDKTVREL